MLNNFLRDLYKSKIVHPEILTKNLVNWKVSNNSLLKTYKFDNFDQALKFATFAESLLREKQILSKISNVFNKVEVHIQENTVQAITLREYEVALTLDKLGNSEDPIEELINFDYTRSNQAFPVRYSLDVNTLIPTDPWQGRAKYLNPGADSYLKLL